MNGPKIFESAELFIWESVIKIGADVNYLNEIKIMPSLDTSQKNTSYRIVLHIIIAAIIALVLGLASGYLVATAL